MAAQIPGRTADAEGEGLGVSLLQATAKTSAFGPGAAGARFLYLSRPLALRAVRGEAASDRVSATGLRGRAGHLLITLAAPLAPVPAGSEGGRGSPPAPTRSACSHPVASEDGGA